MSNTLEQEGNLDDEFSSIDSLTDDIGDDNTPVEGDISPTVPEKFKGKSMEDVVEAYLNLEQEYGKRSQEIGELRKLADTFIQKELGTTHPQAQTEDITEDDLLDNPQDTVGKIVEKNPVVKELQDTITTMQREQALAKFSQKHEGWESLVATTDFQEWANATPYRTRLYMLANNYDLDAADELLSIYKDTKATPTTSTTSRDTALKQAHSERGGKGGGRSKKIYKRSEIIRLKIENPSKYESMQPEIMLAYAEGRVK